MELCKICGAPLDAGGFTACGLAGAEKCHRDRATFEAQVEESKAALDLHILARMERNEMPECFQFTRAAGVAMAQLLMEALRQNQELLKAVPKH